MKSENVHSIVTLHLSQAGDLLFSLPALDALRARWPEAHVTAVMRPFLAELVRESPLVDETLWPEGISARGLLWLARQTRQRRPELVVCFSQAPFLFLTARLSRAPVRAGFGGAWLCSVLNHSIAKVGPPCTANNLRLAESLGCPPRQRTYEGLVRPSPTVEAAVAGRLAAALGVDSGEFVVFGPATSARRTHKEWPRNRFLELAKRVTSRHGMKVLFLGAAPFLTEDDCVSGAVIDWSGTTTLLEAAAVLSRARLFIGVDSGLMHLAAAMGAPVVGLFGPTDPETTGPLCDKHRIVQTGNPGRPGRMDQIQVEAVMSAADKLLDGMDSQ